MIERHEDTVLEQAQALTLPAEQRFLEEIEAINRFQALVRQRLVRGHDFGVIPGTQKPTLLKPGAEKITKLLGMADHYEIIDRVEDWDRPLFRYLIRCDLISVSTGVVISQGLGECNSMEPKYRWRDARRKCPSCGAEAIIKGKEQYGGGWVCFKKQGGCGATWAEDDERITGQKTGRVENEEVHAQVNTILKMAKKRALVDAALSAARLSDMFSQDQEDYVAETQVSPVEPEASAVDEATVVETPPTPELAERDAESIKTLGDLFNACKDDFQVDRRRVLSILGAKNPRDIEDPASAYARIREEMLR